MLKIIALSLFVFSGLASAQMRGPGDRDHRNNPIPNIPTNPAPSPVGVQYGPLQDLRDRLVRCYSNDMICTGNVIIDAMERMMLSQPVQNVPVPTIQSTFVCTVFNTNYRKSYVSQAYVSKLMAINEATNKCTSRTEGNWPENCQAAVCEEIRTPSPYNTIPERR